MGVDWAILGVVVPWIIIGEPVVPDLVNVTFSLYIPGPTLAVSPGARVLAAF